MIKEIMNETLQTQIDQLLLRNSRGHSHPTELILSVSDFQKFVEEIKHILRQDPTEEDIHHVKYRGCTIRPNGILGDGTMIITRWSI